MFQQATLPITLHDGINLDVKEAQQYGESLSGDYCFAEPFPHAIIDNFLPEEMAEGLLAHFPLAVASRASLL